MHALPYSTTVGYNMQIKLESVELETDNTSGVLEYLGGSADRSLLTETTLSPGDIHSCMFQIQGSSPAAAVRLGVLLLRWRRLR